MPCPRRWPRCSSRRFGSWSLTGVLITGLVFVAKEAVISPWAQTYAVEDPTDADPEEQAESPLAAQRREIGLWWTVVGTVVQLTGAWALAVLVFNALRLVLYWRGR
ncbi:hypothetical protein [Corynebacterium marambiense]|uniref:hypothetical protein n=1 Tax=Corynebacterium marambiense TaxID=2765364 RepID=UPI00396A9549